MRHSRLLPLRAAISILTSHCLLVCLWAQSEDPLALLYPPDLVMEHQEAIGLSEAQREDLFARIRASDRQFTELREKMGDATDALRASLRAGPGAELDPASARAELDRLGGLEREFRGLQLELLIDIRDTLTAEQHEQLDAIRTTQQGQLLQSEREALKRSLTARVERVKAGVEQLAAEGAHPADVLETMGRFSELMDQGKPDRASTILDLALEQLREHGAKPEPAGDETALGGAQAPEFPEHSAERLRQEIDDLWAPKDDIAWKRIEWEPNLVRGLERAQEAGKPVLLWVFIDRPADDRRC